MRSSRLRRKRRGPGVGSGGCSDCSVIRTPLVRVSLATRGSPRSGPVPIGDDPECALGDGGGPPTTAPTLRHQLRLHLLVLRVGDRAPVLEVGELVQLVQDRKSTRLNSSHLGISYAVFCLKKKK